MVRKYMYMSLMKSVKIIAVLLLLPGISAFAQFSVEDYLSAPFQDAEITGLAKQLEYINNESFRSPLFREMEIRMRTDDLNASPEDIRLRLGFLNPMEQKANRLYESSQTKYLEVKYKYETNQLLANRYKQLIRHYFLSEYKELLNEEIGQLLMAYEQMQLQTANFKDWVETDERILKKELKRKDVTTSIEMLGYIIGEILDVKDSIRWDKTELISINKMQEVLLPDTAMMIMEMELAMKSFELDQMAFKVEKAKSRSNIGYIQAEYDLEDDDGINSSLGFQLGISIPLFNTDKPKLQRKKLELLEQEYKLVADKDETSFDQYSLNKAFRKYIWSYQQVSNRLQDVELLGKEITYDKMEDFVALIKYHGNLKILQHEIYLDCLNTYIDILALSGKLSSAPYLNYISDELSPFSYD